jgi:ribosomal protein L12E/L44/L45/RPP1/RPP2
VHVCLLLQEVKRAALHELIEFVTANGSSNAAAAAGVNNNNKSAGNKDANGQEKDAGKDGTSQSLLSSAFDPLFYQEMVNTVRISGCII